MANHLGNHIAEVVHWDIPENDKLEHPQVLVELKIVDGPASGAQKFWYGSLHPNAIEITTAGLVEMGFKGNLCDLVQDNTSITPNTGLEKGRQVEIYIKADEYKGKTRERVNINTRKPAVSMPIQKARGVLAKYQGAVTAQVAKLGVQDAPGF